MTAATLVPTTAPETDEEADLRAAARAVATRCREREDHAACWTALADSGFTALREPEGGAPAATATMTAIVVEELAGAVCGAPLVGALLAGELARLAGAELPGPATVLLTADLAALADLAGPGPDATGVAWDAAAPVAWALALDGDRLVAVPLGAPTPTQDLSRPVAAPSGPPTDLGPAPADPARFASFARLLLAADLLGNAERVFADAVDHAKGRVQFGVPIGSFQAVQHLCGAAYAQLEALRSAVLTAAWALDTGPGDGPGDGAGDGAGDGPGDGAGDGGDHVATSLVAKAYAARVGVEVVETAVQVFGGVAITWEFAAHRHLRRALLSAVVFGDADAAGGALLEEIDGPQ